jgi:hypothetical protein
VQCRVDASIMGTKTSVSPQTARGATSRFLLSCSGSLQSPPTRGSCQSGWYCISTSSSALRDDQRLVRRPPIGKSPPTLPLMRRDADEIGQLDLPCDHALASTAFGTCLTLQGGLGGLRSRRRGVATGLGGCLTSGARSGDWASGLCSRSGSTTTTHHRHHRGTELLRVVGQWASGSGPLGNRRDGANSPRREGLGEHLRGVALARSALQEDAVDP